MPIKGLTDREARFPRLGILRKGGEKTEKRPGQDLDYFRMDADIDILNVFQQHYGNQPRQINIMLPYQRTEQCFPSWMEEWASGSLVRRCDGESISIKLNEDKKTYSRKPSPCMQQCGCKAVGRLIVVIPELQRLGFIEVQTHSKWDILGLTENLVAVEQASGDLRGIPFVLSRKAREVSVPMGDKRVRQTKSLLSIEVSPAYAQKMISSGQSRAIQAIEAQVQVLPESQSYRALPVGASLPTRQELNSEFKRIVPSVVSIEDAKKRCFVLFGADNTKDLTDHQLSVLISSLAD
jgi:Recombination directionality factor-like